MEKRNYEQSKKLDNVCYDIRGPVMDEAMRMEARGANILKLNIGNPAPFGFYAPDEVILDMIYNLRNCEGYSDSRGLFSARKAIMQYSQIKGLPNVQMEHIYTGNGVSELIQLSMNALLDNGDEILIPSPAYPLWTACATLAGGHPVHYLCDEQADWYPDLEDMESKITSATKALVIINPNNPTGVIYGPELLKELVEVARENKLLIFSDEIYDRLLLGDAVHVSTASLCPDLPVITFNGLSKSHVVCGFRCGWMVFSGPGLEEIKSGVMQLAAMRLCGNALTQLVIPAALRDDASTHAMLVPGGRLYEQRKATVEGLSGIPGITFLPNHACFYIFPGIDTALYDFESDQDFALKFLHEKKVLVIPGRGFDWHEDLRFRIVMLPEPQVLSDAMGALGDFLRDHRR